jgi:hypothetical protein
MTNMAELQPVLNELLQNKYLRPIASGKRDGPGQPQSQRYEVNPAIYAI